MFPRHDFTQFDVKFREKKDGMPFGACRHLEKLKQKQGRKCGPLKSEKTTMSKKLTLTKLSKHITNILKMASNEIIIF